MKMATKLLTVQVTDVEADIVAMVLRGAARLAAEAEMNEQEMEMYALAKRFEKAARQ